MAISGTTDEAPADQQKSSPGTAVEITREEDMTPGIVRGWRVDGTAALHQQRVVVATKSEGDLKQIDVAREVVDAIDSGEVEPIQEVVGDE
jgi:hypothetical protein